MLTDTDNLMATIGLSIAVPRLRARIDLLRQQAEAAIKSYVKWPIEQTGPVTEYYDGAGFMDVILRKPYVSSITNVWQDNGGWYGQAQNAFAAGTQLVLGKDYALVVDDTVSRCGILRKLSNLNNFFPSDLFFYGKPGGLAYRGPLYWPRGYGNIKVVYTYGFAVIPDDIKLAVATAVSIVMNSTRWGFPSAGEGVGGHSWSLSITREPEFGTVRQLLSRYRDLAL